MRTCSFQGCGRKVRAKNLCSGHYCQWIKSVELKGLLPRRAQGASPVLEIEQVPCRNNHLEEPCHDFIGGKRNGYGQISVGGKKIYVHRYVWEKANGPIRDDMVIDHRCRNRACCNILHLRVVTPRVNAIENSDSPWAVNAAKTHCRQGHEYTTENTLLPAQGGRKCRECNKIWCRNRAARMPK